MPYVDDSHVPDPQRVLRAGGGGCTYYLLGAFYQKDASSIMKGKRRYHECHDSNQLSSIMYL